MAFNIPSPTMSEVFQSNYPFYVPKYQRGYAWEDEEVQAFIDDVLRLYANDKAEPHFLGGLVHIHIPAANVVSRNLEIVDGQQRMATIYLAVACIANALRELADSASKRTFGDKCLVHEEQIREAFISYKDIVGAQRELLPKLRLSACDDGYFQDLITTGHAVPTRESHKLLGAAYSNIYKNFITDFISSHDEVARLRHACALFKVIADRCFVIHIVSPNRKEAYRLFTVLNDRGRSLSAGDLLRATTLENLESKPVKQKKLEQQWDRILAPGADKTEKFLRAFYPSYTGKRAPAKDLFGTYRKSFLSEATRLASRTEKLVTSMYDDQPVFERLQAGEWPYPTGKATSWHKDRLHRLVNILRHEAAHPLLMSAARLDEKKFIDILLAVELFVFRYISVCKQHPSPIYDIYNSEAENIRNNLATYSTIGLRARLRQLIDLRAGDDRFVESLNSNLQFGDNNNVNREIRHFLTTLESYRRSADRSDRLLKPDTMVVYEVANTTIEHIYSQNSSVADQNDALEAVMNHLGNITVMSASDNSTLGSPSFAIKQKEYAKSSAGLTNELSLLADWHIVEYEARRDRISTLALKVFAVK